jgi:hypothetical protein
LPAAGRRRNSRSMSFLRESRYRRTWTAVKGRWRKGPEEMASSYWNIIKKPVNRTKELPFSGCSGAFGSAGFYVILFCFFSAGTPRWQESMMQDSFGEVRLARTVRWISGPGGIQWNPSQGYPESAPRERRRSATASPDKGCRRYFRSGRNIASHRFFPVFYTSPDTIPLASPQTR